MLLPTQISHSFPPSHSHPSLTHLSSHLWDMQSSALCFSFCSLNSFLAISSSITGPPFIFSTISSMLTLKVTQEPYCFALISRHALLTLSPKLAMLPTPPHCSQKSWDSCESLTSTFQFLQTQIFLVPLSLLLHCLMLWISSIFTLTIHALEYQISLFRILFLFLLCFILPLRGNCCLAIYFISLLWEHLLSP